MPEVRLDPLNQCLADGSSVEEEAAISAQPAPAPAPVSSDSAATRAGDLPGSAALVRQFGDGAAARGASDRGFPPCLTDQLKAVVACGTALAIAETPAFYLGALNCIASVIAVDECLAKHSRNNVE